MKRKIVGIFVCMLLIITTIPVVGTININLRISEDIVTLGRGDELDQYQILLEVGFPIGNAPNPPDEEPCYNWTVAQSFKPSKMILTRVMLLFMRISTTIYPLVMTIRDSLNGDDLVFLKINPEDVPIFPEVKWIEFDFEDINVTVEKSYYIVCYTTNVTDNMYGWGLNRNDSYTIGQAFISFDDGITWIGNVTEYDDMCFMTFGRDNNRPYSPSVDGPNSGTAGVIYDYDFTADDPNGDDMAYHVEWGDGGVDEGFVESGGGFTLTHSWSEQGAFTIKAKLIDEYGEESHWAIYPVTMPRSKAVSTPFLNFLENHPILYQLLLRFLRL